jgi:hypothetical protein
VYSSSKTLHAPNRNQKGSYDATRQEQCSSWSIVAREIMPCKVARASVNRLIAINRCTPDSLQLQAILVQVLNTKGWGTLQSLVAAQTCWAVSPARATEPDAACWQQLWSKDICSRC